MDLPYKVDSLEDVPESARELYVEDGDSFRLPVTGVEAEEDIAGLKSALAKLKRDLAKAKGKSADGLSDEDRDELERLRQQEADLEEEKAKAEGRWADLRTKLEQKHEKALDEISKKLQHRDVVIERLTVQNQLRAAIADAGVKPEYHRAVEALLRERGPKVDWDSNDMPTGIFPDEVEGDKSIGDFVKAWVQTDEASAYMPPENGAGGGGAGAGGGGGGKKASWQGKNYADMTADEKVEYTNAKYGEGAAA